MVFRSSIENFLLSNLFRHDFWMKELLGNPLYNYFLSLFVLFFSLAAIKFIRRWILQKLRFLADSTKSRIDNMIIDFVELTLFPLLYLAAFYISVNQLVLGNGLKKVIDSIAVILISIQATRFSLSVSVYLLETRWFVRDDSLFTPTTSRGILVMLRLIFWGLCATFIMDNLGFNISTIVAGLGIGGVAIALASQNILNDLFNYFVIFFDRPFEAGDYIVVGDFDGTVRQIGIKTTRICSLSGEELVFSNSDLTSSRIRNYRKMAERRVRFNLGIVYQTDSSLLSMIPGEIEKIIGSFQDTRFGRCHFKEFGDFSLNIETVYFINGNDYTRYMDVQQQINLNIMKRFEEMKISFAYPTQTLFITRNAE